MCRMQGGAYPSRCERSRTPVTENIKKHSSCRERERESIPDSRRIVRTEARPRQSAYRQRGEIVRLGQPRQSHAEVALTPKLKTLSPIELPEMERLTTKAIALPRSELIPINRPTSFVKKKTNEPTYFSHEVTPKFGNICQSLESGGGRRASVCRESDVRRITPLECERLMGFEDHYTAIQYKGKAAADGPRYKVLGNSMAVPCMRWIGERIQMVESLRLA